MLHITSLRSSQALQESPIPSLRSNSTDTRSTSPRQRRRLSTQNGMKILLCKWYVSVFGSNPLLLTSCQPSRVAADFELEVYDWDQIGKADTLGSGKIDLADIEPFTSVERTIPLSSQKHGQKGSVRIRLLFQPEIIVKTRKNTSTFSAAGRAMTQISHMPTGVVLGAGRGVAHVGSDIKGIFKSKDHAKTQAFEVDNDRGSVVELPAGQSSQPINGTGGPTPAAFPTSPSVNGEGSLNGHVSDRGTLRVVVMEAKDMSASDVKPYVVLRVGDKEHKTKHSHKTATPEWCVPRVAWASFY